MAVLAFNWLSVLFVCAENNIDEVEGIENPKNLLMQLKTKFNNSSVSPTHSLNEPSTMHQLKIKHPESRSILLS